VKLILIGALFVVVVCAVILYFGWYALGAAEGMKQAGGGFDGAQPPMEEPSPNHNQSFEGALRNSPTLGFLMVYQWALIFEGIGVFILAMSVLCGLVAGDRRSGALPLYLTRAVSREHYLLGKLLAAFGLSSLLLVLPMLLLGLMDYGFSLPGMGAETLERGGRALVAGVMWSALISATVVAVSTLTPRPRLASVLCAVAAFIPMIAVTILFETFEDLEGRGIFTALSPLMLAFESAAWLLEMSRDPLEEMPRLGNGAWATLLLAAWTLLLVIFADWRVRKLGETRE
jgi:ABC-type transport system involved in multi-copper enzyme maturation permease subunit